VSPRSVLAHASGAAAPRSPLSRSTISISREPRRFRDKLAMRDRAQETTLPVPPFVGLFNDERVRAFAREGPRPWILKPRRCR